MASVNFSKSKKLKGKDLPCVKTSSPIGRRTVAHLSNAYSGFKIHTYGGENYYYKIRSEAQPMFYNNKNYRGLLKLTKAVGKTCYGVDFLPNGDVPIIISKPIIDEDIPVGCLVDIKKDIGDENLGDAVAFNSDTNTIIVDGGRLYFYQTASLRGFIFRLCGNLFKKCSYKLENRTHLHKKDHSKVYDLIKESRELVDTSKYEIFSYRIVLTNVKSKEKSTTSMQILSTPDSISSESGECSKSDSSDTSDYSDTQSTAFVYDHEYQVVVVKDAEQDIEEMLAY